jgi:hypothetical protein
MGMDWEKDIIVKFRLVSLIWVMVVQAWLSWLPHERVIARVYEKAMLSLVKISRKRSDPLDE